MIMYSTLTPNQIVEYLLVALIFVLIAKIIQSVVTMGQDEYIEEPNPEYLNQLTIARNNFVNELLEHLSVNLCFPKESVDNCVSELVAVDVNRFVMIDQDQIVTILIHWDRSVTISFFVNPELSGENVREMSKKFSLRRNMVSWKAISKFCNQVVNKCMPKIDDAEATQEVIAAALVAAEKIDDARGKELLFRVAENYPWQGQARNPQVALEDYAMILTYVVKNYKQEFVEFLKNHQNDGNQEPKNYQNKDKINEDVE